MIDMKRSMLRIMAAALAISVAPLFALDEKTDQKKTDTIFVNREFYAAFKQIPPVKRDDFWESRLNSLVMTRARVVKIDSTGRYKKKYRIILDDAEASLSGLRFMYYVFIDSQDSIDLLAVDEIFEFSGQIMGFTPLSMDRNGYVFDILLEKGAIIVQ